MGSFARMTAAAWLGGIFAVSLSACGSMPRARAPSGAALDLGHAVISADTGATLYDFTRATADDEYVGGDAMRLVNAPVAVSLAVLEQPDALWNLLPRLRGMDVVQGGGSDRSIAVRHAMGPFEGGYTMRVVREDGPSGSHTIWFWVDTTRPRDLDNAWGCFRLIPLGRDKTLLGYQVRVALGPGWVRWLFLGRVHRAALTLPDRAKALVEDRAGQLSSGPGGSPDLPRQPGDP